MKRTTGDPAFFFKKVRGVLEGMTCTYVDDDIQAGTPGFERLSEKTSKRFDCHERELDNFKYVGVEVETKENEFLLHQNSYLKRLVPLAAESSFKAFSSFRQNLRWLVSTRPDIACAVGMATQVTQQMFEKNPVEEVKAVNRVLTYLKKNPSMPLRYPKLQKESLTLQVFSDASFANSRDGTSQLGYVVFMMDKDKNCQLILWSSHKSKRVTRSVVGAETMALADAFDAAYSLKHDLQAMLGHEVPITIYTDSLSLFDVLTKATIPMEKRLMIDVLAIKDAYKNRELNTIGFIRTNDNPADVLTKIMAPDVLTKILSSAKLDFKVEQWIERPT
jgi:hypothetical protein